MGFEGGKQKFKIQQKHDQIKRKFAYKLEANYIEIPYTEKNIHQFLEQNI